MTLCRSCHAIEDRRIKPPVAWNKGKKLTEEHKMNMSLAKKGKAPWNKGLSGASWKLDEETGRRVYTSGFTAS